MNWATPGTCELLLQPAGAGVAGYGHGFLKIMLGFELARVTRDLYVGLHRSRALPVQIVLGEADPALKVTTFGEIARRASGVDHIHRLPGMHGASLPRHS
jgi:hypothetical protein